MTRQAPALGRVLVTGGAGFIGCALCAAARRRGRALGRASTTCTRRCTRRRERPGSAARRRRAGRRPTSPSPTTWDAVLADVRPDVVVHLAAETGTGQSLTEATRHGMVNVVGTTQMLDALSAAPGTVPDTSS